MPPTWTRFLVVLFCLCFLLQFSCSQSFELARRQDENTPEPTRTDDGDKEGTPGEADGNDEEADSATPTESDEGKDSATSESGSPTETPDLEDDVLESKNTHLRLSTRLLTHTNIL